MYSVRVNLYIVVVMADKSGTIQNRLSTLQYNHTAISADTGNKQQQFRAHSIKLAWSLSEKD